jgi:hypothetical protein
MINMVIIIGAPPWLLMPIVGIDQREISQKSKPLPPANRFRPRHFVAPVP